MLRSGVKIKKYAGNDLGRPQTNLSSKHFELSIGKHFCPRNFPIMSVHSGVLDDFKGKPEKRYNDFLGYYVATARYSCATALYTPTAVPHCMRQPTPVASPNHDVGHRRRRWRTGGACLLQA